MFLNTLTHQMLVSEIGPFLKKTKTVGRYRSGSLLGGVCTQSYDCNSIDAIVKMCLVYTTHYFAT